MSGRKHPGKVLSFIIICLPYAIFAQSRIVMVTEEWPPFRINNASTLSGFSGIDIDLMKKLEQALGIPIEIQRHPWARALEMMREGHADMITGIAYTAERSEFIQYIPSSYASVTPVFYTQKGKGAGIRSYADLSGKSIGYSTNSFYYEPFSSDGRLNKVSLTTEIQILQMLSLSRLDVAIGTDPNMSWDVKRLGYGDKLEMTEYKPSATTQLYIGLSRKSSIIAMATAIDVAIRGMKEDGSINRITEAYR
jgi:polar amino acid transport system substrate-binding protein